MTRAGVLFAVVAFLVPAVAQPPRQQPTPPAALLARLPAHLADKAVVEELKLDAEQVAAVRAVKFKSGDAVAPEKLKELLKPEQYTRALQLMAQDALRSGRGGVVTPAALVAVPGETFRRYPELADAAKLTREQRRRAATAGAASGTGAGGLPAAVHVVLTPEQTAALTAFVGPLRATAFAVVVPERGGGPPFGRVVESAPTAAPFVNSQPLLMLAANNRAELKLTDEQAQTLQELVNTAYRGGPREAGGPPPTPDSQQKRIADAEAKLAKTLSADQMKRLKQIELWQQIPPGSDDFARYAVPRVATALALTPDQKAGFKAAGKAHQDAAAAAFAAATSADDLKARLAGARGLTAVAVAATLTAEQAGKVADLFGPEYRGGGPGGMQNDFGRKMRAAYFGCYQFELMVVNRFAGVPDDLKLSEEQKAGLSAAERDFNQAYQQSFDLDGPEAETAKKMGERSKAMQKVFDDHLNPDQRKRIVELSIQLRQQLNQQNMGGPGGSGAVMYPATAVPGVADALRLTPGQRKRIIDTGEEDETLTAAQRADLKRLAGPPLPGGFNFGGRAQSRPAQPSAKVGLLHAGTAHADLKLTAQQAYHIAEVIEEHSAEVRPVNPGRNAPEFGHVEPPPAESVTDTVEACEKACVRLLTDRQRDRLGQLMLQASAHASLTAVFARPEVTEKLAFTPAQRAKLDDIAADYRARAAQVGSLPTGAGWQEVRTTALTEMREAARVRLMAVLTDAQRAAWRELTGTPSPAVSAGLPTTPGPVGATRDP